MSVPERHASRPAPTPRRAPALAPVVHTASRRQRRPAFHPGFLFFSAAVVTALVIGVVVLNVLLAQQAFQVRTLRENIAGLEANRIGSTEHLAALSAPGRIQTWANARGMVTPPDVIVLPVPGKTGGAHP